MLQIKQLTSRECNVASNEQKLIYGGSKAGDELWSGYASEKYDISSSNIFKVGVDFRDADSGTLKGTIATINGKTSVNPFGIPKKSLSKEPSGGISN